MSSRPLLLVHACCCPKYMHLNANTHSNCTQLQTRTDTTRCHTSSNVKKCTAKHCNTLQHTATHCNVHLTQGLFTPLQIVKVSLQHTATHCNTLQHTATHYNTLHLHCNALQRIATHCNTLQHTASRCTHCNALQHTATHCNTLHKKTWHTCSTVPLRLSHASCKWKEVRALHSQGTNKYTLYMKSIYICIIWL